MINIAAMIATQTAMRASTQIACQKIRERQKNQQEKQKENKGNKNE